METNACIRFSHLFIMILIVLSTIHIIPPQNSAEAQVTPDVNVSVNPSILQVDVSPLGTGIASSVATLENTGPHHVSCSVTVDIEGYQASPRMLTVALTPYDTRDIIMSIAAELRSAYQVKSGTITVTVKSVDFIPLDNYFVNSAGFQVNTLPYSRLVVLAKDPLVKVWPGRTTKLKFEVLNEGNVEDDARLDVTNKEELYKLGFSVALEASGSVVVPPRDIINMNVHIVTPKKIWKDDYHVVNVRAVSSFPNAQVLDYSVTVWVRGVYVPGFEPISALMVLFVLAAFLGKRKQELF